MVQEINQSIGHKIRAFRTMRGISQARLANSLGVSAQQVQKYEQGINGVSIGKLKIIAECLSIPITAFLDETIEPLEIDNIRQYLALMKSVNALSYRQRQALTVFVRSLTEIE